MYKPPPNLLPNNDELSVDPSRRARAAKLVEAALYLRASGDAVGARGLLEQALALDPANLRARQLRDTIATAEEARADARTILAMPNPTLDVDRTQQERPAAVETISGAETVDEEFFDSGTTTHHPAPRKGLVALGVGGAVAGLLAIVIAVFRLTADPAPPPMRRPPTAATQAKPAPSPPVQAEPPTPPAAEVGEQPPAPAPAERATAAKAAEPKVEASPKNVEWVIRSAPPGASVTRLDTGESLGKTPLTVGVPRGSGKVALRLDLEGHRSVQAEASLAANATISAELSVDAPAKPAPPEPVDEPSKDPKDRDALLDPYAE